MGERDLGTYQMLWDCPRCDTPKLLGLNHRHCPNCGAPQDPQKRYFPKDEDKVAVADHVFTGADWSCPSCDSPNSNKAHFCGNCGSPKDGSKQVGLKTEAAPPPPPPEPPKSGGTSKVVMFVLGALLLLCCGGLALSTFWKKEAALTVQSHEWTKSVEVEAHKLVTESAWKESVPAGAQDVSCRPEKKDTKKVQDGETCKTSKKDQGDGTFKEVETCEPKYREEPVMADKCSYKVMKWATDRTEVASGGVKDPPRWPQVNLVGEQREGKKTETWTVTVKDGDGKAHECEVDQGRWTALKDGQAVKGQVSVVTGGVDCDSLGK